MNLDEYLDAFNSAIREVELEKRLPISHVQIPEEFWNLLYANDETFKRVVDGKQEPTRVIDGETARCLTYPNIGGYRVTTCVGAKLEVVTA